MLSLLAITSLSLLLQTGLASDIPAVIPNVVCQETADCLSFSKRLPISPVTKLVTAGYSCLNQQCVYVLSPGSECQQASQCSYYSFLNEVMLKNKTNLLPAGVSLSDVPKLMENVCTPSACSISSSCNKNFEVLFPEETNSCCMGIDMGQKCEQRLDQLPVCQKSSVCSPSGDITSSDLTCQESIPAKESQWIGIVLSLIAAALSNLGLNLQKFALRKRHEKVVKRIESERQSVFHQLTNLKASVTNFYKSNVSNPSISDQPAEPTLTNVPTGGQTTPTTISTIRHTEPKETEDEGVTKDGDQFQAKLDWKTLAKNPRWWLGFIVFAIGTFTNFAALQFAAQSLIGPLGSFSLVCNVVLAPLLNGEIWTWKDVVGVLLIVAGSAIVVVFSGHPIGDYDLCTLLKLFRTTGTIVFLTVACSLLFTIFVYIIVVEKNLDLGGSRTEGIEEAIEEGELVDIIANPKPEGRFKQRKSKFGILVEDKNQDGSLIRVVTISAPKKSLEDLKVDDKKVVMRNKRRPSMTSLDAIAEEPNAIRRRGSIPEYDDKRSSMLSVKSNFANMPLVDSEGNQIQIQDLFKGKDAEGGSIHSVALTFKLPEPAVVPGEEVDAISLKSFKSGVPNDPVVVFGGDKKPVEQISWMRRLKARLMRYKIVRDIMDIELIPRFEKKIPMESDLAHIGLPFSYATLGGLMATLLTLFAKATINLLTSSFQGQNQFTSFSSFLFLGVTVFCALSQIYWINLGLARYDALLQIPVFYVVWTLFDVIGGGIFYDEFTGFSTVKYVFFIMGVAIIFVGVAVLAGRLKQLQDSEKEEVVQTPEPANEV